MVPAHSISNTWEPDGNANSQAPSTQSETPGTKPSNLHVNKPSWSFWWLLKLTTALNQVLVNNSLFEHNTHICFSFVQGSLHVTMAELNSCHRNHMAHRVGNIYSLAVCRKSLLAPALNYSLILQHRKVNFEYQYLYKVSNALTESQHRLLITCTAAIYGFSEVWRFFGAYLKHKMYLLNTVL